MGSDSAGDPFPGGTCCLEQQPARSHTRRPPESSPSPHKATPPASPVAAPRLPTSAVFSPPSLPPGSEPSRAFAHNHCLLVHARALSVLILTHFWTFRIFVFVCSSSIKYTTSHCKRGLLSSFVVTFFDVVVGHHRNEAFLGHSSKADDNAGPPRCMRATRGAWMAAASGCRSTSLLPPPQRLLLPPHYHRPPLPRSLAAAVPG